jgi:hypothetical protein
MLCLRKAIVSGSALLLFLALGCGGGPTVVPVTGVLTYKGQPVPSAYLDFTPESGRPSWGKTDEQGRFKLSYDPQKDGAIVGKHKVWAKHHPNTQKELEAQMQGRRIPMSKEMAQFFDKYSAEKSKVEVVVEKNTRELKLDWD